MFGKILLISPHRDDEVLGCGGLISQIDPNNLHIRYYNKLHPLVATEVYDAENEKLLNTLGCGYSRYMMGVVNKLDQIAIAELINDMEYWINQLQPDTVLIPFPSYNQDHRHLFDAAITATRVHDVNYYVKTVLAYEQPETLHTNRFEPHFVPHIYVPIDIEKKIELYKIYQSQQRGHRSIKHVRALAEVRGMQCNEEYAEAFMVVRGTWTSI